jgi:hypothetical protein
MKRSEIAAVIQEVGIIPAIRVSAAAGFRSSKSP